MKLALYFQSLFDGIIFGKKIKLVVTDSNPLHANNIMLIIKLIKLIDFLTLLYMCIGYSLLLLC